MPAFLCDILGPEVIHHILIPVHTVGPVVEVELRLYLRTLCMFFPNDSPAPLHEVPLRALIHRKLESMCCAIYLRGNCRRLLHYY
jgi:hypothetical protein